MSMKFIPGAVRQRSANDGGRAAQGRWLGAQQVRLVAIFFCMSLFVSLVLRLVSAQGTTPFVYWVYDQATRDSQFGYWDGTVSTTVGGVFNNHDIEGIACLGSTLYGASGRDGTAPSQLFQVTADLVANTTSLSEIGQIHTATNDLFYEVSSLGHKDNALWAFAAEGTLRGIIRIDPANAIAELVQASTLDVAGVEWVGDTLWLVAGRNFYSWTPGGVITQRFSIGGSTQIEALDSFPDPQTGKYLLYFGGDGITDVQVIDPDTSTIIANRGFTTPDDIESFTFCTPPGQPTPTPTATDTPTATSTDTPTATSTDTPTATSTDTPTATSTDTPTATSTDTPTATSTDTPTATSTETPVTPNDPPPTDTSTPTPINPGGPTPTDTNTPPATSTDTPTATNTSLPTATSPGDPTATATPTPTGTLPSGQATPVTATPTPAVPTGLDPETEPGAPSSQSRALYLPLIMQGQDTSE